MIQAKRLLKNENKNSVQEVAEQNIKNIFTSIPKSLNVEKHNMFYYIIYDGNYCKAVRDVLSLRGNYAEVN